MSASLRFLLPAVAMALAATLPLAAQPERLPLTLQESVERALRYNLQLEAERLSPDIARQEVIMEEAQFDPVLGLEAAQSFRQRSIAESTLEDATRPRSDTFVTRAAVSKLIETGAVLSLESRLVRTKTNSTLATLNPAYDSEVSLNIRQPLLRGRGEAVRAARERARIAERLSRHDLAAAVMDVVLATELAFFQLVFALEELELRRFSLGLAESFLEEVEFRREAGAADALDALRAEVSLSGRREALVQAEQFVQDRQDDLLNLIGEYRRNEEMETEVVPAPLEPIEVDPLEPQEAIDLMRRLRPEYLFVTEQIEQFELDMRIARNLGRPTLDLGAGVGYTGLDRSARDSFSDLAERDGRFWRVEATFSVPIGMREERARQRRAELLLERQIVQLRRFEQDLLVEARTSVRAMDAARERVELAGRFTDAGRRQYEMEQERYRAGVTTTRNVLDAQAELEEARLRELSAQVTLYEATARLRRATGESFDLSDRE